MARPRKLDASLEELRAKARVEIDAGRRALNVADEKLSWVHVRVGESERAAFYENRNDFDRYSAMLDDETATSPIDRESCLLVFEAIAQGGKPTTIRRRIRRVWETLDRVGVLVVVPWFGGRLAPSDETVAAAGRENVELSTTRTSFLAFLREKPGPGSSYTWAETAAVRYFHAYKREREELPAFGERFTSALETAAHSIDQWPPTVELFGRRVVEALGVSRATVEKQYQRRMQQRKRITR